MDKKALMPAIALVALLIVVPVIAAPAAWIPYTADVRLEVTSPGKVWTTEGGILHVKGLIAEGSFDSADLGISDATMWKTIDYVLNMITGEGTMHGKFILTVDGMGTLEGSFRDKITESTHLSGTVVGQGTGGFAGWKTMGTWYGDIMGDGSIENVLEAKLLLPKG
jgi:hypothetical protein